MQHKHTRKRVDGLLVLMLVYAAASLLHFVHNAVFIADYPNLPGWISASGIYLTWFGITAIGIIGYLLVRSGKYLLGLVTIAVYGIFGLDGLDHYLLAPISAHSLMMNLTIWLEAGSALIVLIVVGWLLVSHYRVVSQNRS